MINVPNRIFEVVSFVALLGMTATMLAVGVFWAITVFQAGVDGRGSLLLLALPVAGVAATIPMWRWYRIKFGYAAAAAAQDKTKEKK